MFDFFPEEQVEKQRNALRQGNLASGPGVFTGFGSALADALPSAALTSASSWAAVLDAFGKASAYANASADAVMLGQPAPDMAQVKAETIDKMGDSKTALKLRQVAKDYAPDPSSVGMAGQITHGVLSSLAKAAAYAPTGPVAPVLFGGDLGIGRAQELTDKGVDGGTAAMAGVVTGVANAAGLRLPAAMGASRLQSAAIGAVANPALNVAEVGAVHLLLQHADYEKVAEQYQPFDPVSLAVAAVTGGAFGAAFHQAKTAAKPGSEVPHQVEPPPNFSEEFAARRKARQLQARQELDGGKYLTPDEHAAALTMNEVRTRDADTLTQPGDFSANGAARDAQALARQQLDGGEQVSVAQQVAAEQSQLDAAYQRVLDSPAGEAYDPLVRIEPNDIEGAILARGGWKGHGDADVKGSGWGLAKFIWRHGEESKKAPELQVAREDVLAFPEVIRSFEPAVHTDHNGSQYREWRVERQGPDGAPRQVVYVDKTMGERGRHVVSMYVQEPGRAGFDAPLSQRKTDWHPESLGKWSDTRAEDTAAGLLHQPGQEQSVSTTVAQPGILERVRDAVEQFMGRENQASEPPAARQAATPEQAHAQEIMARDPNAMVRLEDGRDVSMADLMRDADTLQANAKTEAAAFKAAVNCALRFPE